LKEKVAKKRSETFCFSIPTVIIMSSSNLSNNGSDDNSTGAGKKAKKLDPPGRDGDGADFDAVRTAVLSLSASLAGGRDNPAARAALEGLDRELSRRRRDEALRAKFLGESAVVGRQNHDGGGGGEGEGLSPAEIVMVDASDTGIPAPPPSSPAAADPRMEEDGEEENWHEVQENSGSEHPNVPGGGGGDDPHPHASSSSSYPAGGSLGSELAREAISAVALFEVRVRSPVQAAAAALHAAMRGPRLGFACTGIPDPGTAKSSAGGGGAGTGGGFAPPVRELPKTHFLPHGWNSDPNRVAIRYRKAGVGSAILLVRSEAAAAWGPGGGDEDALASIPPDRDWIKVSLVPNAATIAEAEAAEGPPPLVFAAGEHVNLSSLRLALASSSLQEQQQSSGGGRGGGGAGTGGVAPALHYKRLPALLSRFAEAFDLGGTAEDGGAAAAAGGPGAPAAGGEAGTPLPYVDATVLRLPAHAAAAAAAGRPGYTAAPAWGGPGPIPPPPHPAPYPDESRSPTFDSVFPGLQQPGANRGDFPEDLRVGGVGGGGIGGVGPSSSSPWVGGNLMGPNHPFFAGVGVGGSGISGVGPGSGFGMRPRFYRGGGPPGGPTDVDGDGRPRPPPPGAPSNPRRNLGDPNPDHLSPPNSFHSNMFM
jgi:hypothetical protein